MEVLCFMAKKAKKTKQTKRRSVPKRFFASRLALISLSMTASLLLCITTCTGYLVFASHPTHSQEFLSRKGVEEEYNELPGNGMKVKGVQHTSTVILNGSRNKKQIALTFDAEMTNGMRDNVLAGRPSYDSRIIDTLNNTQTKATLFITGMWAQLYPHEVQSFAKNSLFEIGSHSYADTSFSGYCYGLSPTPDGGDLKDIQETQKILKNLTGRDNTLFRFPGGCYDDNDINIVTKEAHLVIVHWDVVGGDGFNENTQSIANAVVNTTQNGSIIVLHMNGAPTAPRTADALPDIISRLKSKGFEFVTVSELLGLK